MAGFRISTDDFTPAINDAKGRLAKAATATIQEAAGRIKTEGRNAIRAAGMGSRFANSLRVDVYPNGRVSRQAAAVVRHNAEYAGIFETGGTIAGDPYLWLPLTSTKQRYPVANPFGSRMTAQRYAREVGPLFRLVRPGKPPLLMGKVGGRAVPLFVGVPRVSIGKKFDIHAIVERARADLPAIFQRQLSQIGEG